MARFSITHASCYQSSYGHNPSSFTAGQVSRVKRVLSPELQECMDRNEGGAATSTRGRGETAITQRGERKRRAPRLRDGGFKTPTIVGVLKPPSRESHLPPLDVTPKSMASRTRRTSPRSRSSSKESNPPTNPSNRLADIQTVLTVTQDVVVDSSQNEEISEIRSRG